MSYFNGYHFTGATLRGGRPVPKIGETLVHEGPIVWCKSGLYASPTAWGALHYVRGSTLHRVWCQDIERREQNKFVCRRRTIVTTIDVTKLLRDFARWCVLQVDEMRGELLWASREDPWVVAGTTAWVLASGLGESAVWTAARAAQEARFNAMVDAAFEEQMQ